jgi:ectoine hydroxylase-related dioxygenase (phytanoyl-CoA dioxygenase family)
MHTELTPEQITFYQDNGFIVIHDFLTPDELETWRQYVDEAVAQRADRKLADGRMRSGDAYYDNVFVQRINLWHDHEGMRKLMLDPRIGKMATQLAGVEGVRIWHDQALIKQPWGNPTGWHLDNPYWSFSSRDSISLWVALDDATLQNGCLYFIPGTQKTARSDNPGIGQNIGDLFRVYPEWKDQEAVPAPMKAGSCSFHNGLVAHGAGANMTPRARRAMTCGYMPDGSTFNGTENILPPDVMARLQVGDVLQDDQINPLIYHTSKPFVQA